MATSDGPVAVPASPAVRRARAGDIRPIRELVAPYVAERAIVPKPAVAYYESVQEFRVVEIDGRPLSTWGCDGVVVSTPTGSTAYAFSAGGPVIWPGVEAMLVCPISAHALFARPLVLGPQARLAIEMVPRTEARGVLWFDGRRSFELPPGARVEARRSDRNVDLARLTPAPFVDRLVAKFDLPVQGWRGRGPR